MGASNKEELLKKRAVRNRNLGFTHPSWSCSAQPYSRQNLSTKEETHLLTKFWNEIYD